MSKVNLTLRLFVVNSLAIDFDHSARKGVVRRMAAMLYGLMDFPEKLRWLMKEHRYSQDGLAKKLDVSQGLVGNWCRGVNVPGLELAVALSREFDVSMDYLFDNAYEIASSEALRSDREIRRIVRMIGPERAWGRLILGEGISVEAAKPTGNTELPAPERTANPKLTGSSKYPPAGVEIPGKPKPAPGTPRKKQQG